MARRNTAADTVSQSVHRVERGDKQRLLAHLIHTRDWHQVLVFTRTKHGANRLSEQLSRDGITSAAIHGNKSQTARTRALQEFKGKKLRVLIATDIAARGLDIERLPHVINYELPQIPEDYVHRIGRTGRAGSNGAALSLVSAEEQKLFEEIQKLLKQRITIAAVDGFGHSQGITPPVDLPPKKPRRTQSRQRGGQSRARARR